MLVKELIPASHACFHMLSGDCIIDASEAYIGDSHQDVHTPDLKLILSLPCDGNELYEIEDGFTAANIL